MPLAEMVEQPSFRCQKALAQEGQSVTAVHPLFIPVEKEVISIKGCAHELCSISQRDGDSGRLSHGVGRSLAVAEEDSSRSVVCSRQHEAHKCTGATSCTSSTRALYAIPEREACTCPFRHVYHVPDQSSRGHQVGAVTSGDLEPLDLGGSPPSQSESYVSTGGAEPGCRLSFLVQASTGGVAASPRGGGQN